MEVQLIKRNLTERREEMNVSILIVGAIFALIAGWKEVCFILVTIALAIQINKY